jgi:hypothetical protein
VAKKRVSAEELNWLVQQELTADLDPLRRVSLAVIPDERQGWRVLLQKLDGRTVLVSKIGERVPAVERRLREKYSLKRD